VSEHLTDEQREAIWDIAVGYSWRGVDKPPTVLFAVVERIVAEQRADAVAGMVAEVEALAEELDRTAHATCDHGSVYGYCEGNELGADKVRALVERWKGGEGR
jgi:hypothetical protein